MSARFSADEIENALETEPEEANHKSDRTRQVGTRPLKRLGRKPGVKFYEIVFGLKP